VDLTCLARASLSVLRSHQHLFSPRSLSNSSSSNNNHKLVLLPTLFHHSFNNNCSFSRNNSPIPSSTNTSSHLYRHCRDSPRSRAPQFPVLQVGNDGLRDKASINLRLSLGVSAEVG